MHPPRTLSQPNGRAAYVAAGALTVAAVAFTAWTLYVNGRQALRDAAREQLTAVARLKTLEISAWMTERLADATVLAESVNAVHAVEAAGDPPLEGVRRVLENAVRVYRYEAAELLDETGRQLLAAGAAAPHQQAQGAALRTRASKTTGAVASDLYTDEGARVHLDVGVALRARGGTVTGFLLLHLDPRERLLPAVERWPVPSETAESLLVRREDGSVLFLSPLRHRPASPLTLRVPLSRTEVVAVQAVSGRLGIVEGVDYRGVPVLCATESISDTGWILIAKMDLEEIDAPLRQRACLLAVAGTALAGGGRQHPVFGGHPPLAAPAHPGRHVVIDRGRADHPGAAHRDQGAATGRLHEPRQDLHRAQLVGASSVGSHRRELSGPARMPGG